MRIVGIGTDIVSVARMEEGLHRFGERFAERLLGDRELSDYHVQNYPERFLAKRFAAKEAAAKALGTGFSEGISLTQIQVSHDPLGKPQLIWSGAALARVDALGIRESHLSISDEKQLAVAFVTLCGD